MLWSQTGKGGFNFTQGTIHHNGKVHLNDSGLGFKGLEECGSSEAERSAENDPSFALETIS